MTEPDLRVLTDDRYVEQAAAVIADAIADAIDARGHCRVALAGGSTPRPIYEALATRTDIEWSAVTLLWGDERAVGPDDPASNYRMACRALIDRVDGATAIRIEGERPPAEACAEYARRLGDAPLDVVVLGMGGDGHTASLFPGDTLGEPGQRVVITTSPVPPTTRISLSMATINAARAVVFLVRGADKAERVAEVFAQRRSGRGPLPAAAVAPTAGSLTWILDAAAAAALPHP